MNNQRVGFALPEEVYEQLLEECAYDDEEGTFWDRLQSYYELSIIQGDTVICTPQFAEFISQGTGCDQPGWVHTQGGVGQSVMTCFIIAGPGRGERLIATLRAINKQRDEAAQEEYERSKGGE